MLCIDSTVWIDYFNGRVTPQTDYLDNILFSVPILVGDLIHAEVLQGFQQDSDFKQARRALSKFETVCMVNPDLAIQSARNYRTLRKKGNTVRKTIDSLIATYCIENNHELLHNDSDFDPYENHLGLHVIHPEKELPLIPKRSKNVREIPRSLFKKTIERIRDELPGSSIFVPPIS